VGTSVGSPTSSSTWTSTSGDRGRELQQAGVLGAPVGEVLPGARLGDRFPLGDRPVVDVVHLDLRLLVDLGDLLVVLLGILERELLELLADLGDRLLLVLREPVEYRLRDDERLEHVPEALAAPGRQILRDLLEAEADEAGRGGDGGVERAGLH